MATKRLLFSCMVLIALTGSGTALSGQRVATARGMCRGLLQGRNGTNPRHGKTIPWLVSWFLVLLWFSK